MTVKRIVTDRKVLMIKLLMIILEPFRCHDFLVCLGYSILAKLAEVSLDEFSFDGQDITENNNFAMKQICIFDEYFAFVVNNFL